jgi:hypothetical protein
MLEISESQYEYSIIKIKGGSFNYQFLSMQIAGGGKNILYFSW